MAAESDGVPSAYFTTCKFALYFFGSALNGASYGFCVGVLELEQGICMHPGMEMSVV